MLPEACGALSVFSIPFVLVAGVLLDITSLVELTCELVVEAVDEDVVDDDGDGDELDRTLDEPPSWLVLEVDVSFSELIRLLQPLSMGFMGGTTYVYSAQSKRRRDGLVPCSAVITKVCFALLKPVLLYTVTLYSKSSVAPSG